MPFTCFVNRFYASTVASTLSSTACVPMTWRGDPQLLRWQNYPARAGVENRHSNELIATIAEDDIVI